MNPVVTARVPHGIRDRGNEVLREIGATTTDLVNAAYEYVIREKRLPQSPQKPHVQSGRKLSATQADELDSFFASIKIVLPESLADQEFDALFDQAMEERYADLHRH